jgi:hypothetical protein
LRVKILPLKLRVEVIPTKSTFSGEPPTVPIGDGPFGGSTKCIVLSTIL